MSFGHFFASQTWVFGGVVHAELYGNFFGAAWGVEGAAHHPLREFCLQNSGVSPYIKNIGLGVLIFMAQQVAKHMAKAGVKNVNFTVLRMQKLKSIIAVRRSMKHAFREQETPNADPARLSENTHFFAQNVAESMQNFKKKLPEKIRKNGVLAVEFLITASPNALESKTDEEISAYFSDALRYLQDKHGAENVVLRGHTQR